jgi:DNA-binding XRE family transcriptional regulator
MREIRTSGSVGGRAGDRPVYPTVWWHVLLAVGPAPGPLSFVWGRNAPPRRGPIIPHFGVTEDGVQNRRMGPASSPDYQRMLVRLRQARKDAGFTQAQVAERLSVRQTFVSKVELGERRLDAVELARFASLYGKPLTWFLEPEESEKPRPSPRQPA